MDRSKSKSKSKAKINANASKNAASGNKNKTRKISQKKSGGEPTHHKSKSISGHHKENARSFRELTSPKTIEYSKS
jgi:hypothetical protein